MKMRGRSAALTVATVGVSAAVIEGGKLALMALPNIEVVTLFVALFSYVFGAAGVLSAVVFVLIEPMLWGFGAWTIGYFIYWPIVAVVFMIYGQLRLENRYILTGTAVILTVIFGLLTSFVDLVFYSQSFDNFFARYFAYYAQGAVFYALQISCNAVLFFLVFKYLASKIKKFRER